MTRERRHAPQLHLHWSIVLATGADQSSACGPAVPPYNNDTVDAASIVQDVARTAREELPKALLAALVPAAQLVWKRFEGARINGRKARLRSAMLELSKFLTEYPDTDSHHAPREDAERQLRQLNDEYAELLELEREQAEARRPENRKWWQRVFLLYVPFRPTSWLFFALFWVVLAGGIFGSAQEGAFQRWWAQGVSALFFGLLGIAMFAGFAWLLASSREWAYEATNPKVLRDYRKARPLWMRLFLLGPFSMFAVMGFHFMLMISLWVALIHPELLAALTVSLGLALAVRSVAIHLDMRRFAAGEPDGSTARTIAGAAMMDGIMVAVALDVPSWAVVATVMTGAVVTGVWLGLRRRGERAG